jgi:tetratricopeptide (TPR) repeat protein
MRLTSSFAVFRAEPAEQDFAKARWLAREGRTSAAEQEYRTALRVHPDIAAGWIELVELLRRSGRLEDALATALQAEEHFGPDAAMPLVLKGAALSELGRTRDAVRALEAALERDGNLALAWHELGYAAYRVGEFSRALLALDRAFALEPHTDTLMLRGRILRDAGQYEAAEVAFEGAHQATDHDIPQREAAREVAATRRAATLGGRRPARFTPRERSFVETGSAVIAGPQAGAPTAALLARCLAALPRLLEQLAWHPDLVAGATDSDAPLARAVADALGVSAASAGAIHPPDRPLLVTVCNDGGSAWARHMERLERWGEGLTFALVQHPDIPSPADIVGIINAAPQADVVGAAAGALGHADAGSEDTAETAQLMSNPMAPWQRRAQTKAEGGRQE